MLEFDSSYQILKAEAGREHYKLLAQGQGNQEEPRKAGILSQDRSPGSQTCRQSYQQADGQTAHTHSWQG